ncbi:hypothetical protein QTP86_007605 [Hemibagrus guttatus]|nr:hypothetical protein QTP86_007605 [Hemibagrus guttatus]
MCHYENSDKWSPSSTLGQRATSSRAPSAASSGSGPRPRRPRTRYNPSPEGPAYSATNHHYSPGQESHHWFRESERVWDSVHHQLQHALRWHRWTADLRQSDAPAYQPGQKVWLSTKDIRLQPGDGAAEPPLPLLLDDGTAYEVKEILDSWHRGSQLEYLVDWEGYGPEERSWVPCDDILDPNLLETFHAAHPHRPAPRGRVFGAQTQSPSSNID